MKRIFYQLNENLYFDAEAFLAMAKGSGVNVADFKGMPFVIEGEITQNTFNRLVRVN